ncbi:Vasoactive intestinal polypeptide receptor [Larimichthys crocea]|uniref:Vasoactive intestinal polypeptide receptor n=1 Tax=Larimichthys crocea TaxID=215358 RepID=A0A6G0HKW8_LARCR|nr:Vasoactive intestinal polypeptide receptor [Larimichthys crocea]
MDASQLFILLLLSGYLPKVLSLQMCDVVNEIELEKERCENSTFGNITSGCQGMWDIIACWPSASVGEVVTITCPTYFSYFSDQHRGNLSKTCTADGWTEMHPLDIAVNCGYNLNSTSDDVEEEIRPRDQKSHLLGCPEKGVPSTFSGLYDT